MPIVVFGHPFSSYTWKALIALHENATPFGFRTISPDHPDNVAEWLPRWPLRKFPLLVDGDRQVVETSVIIEYLQLAHPGPVRLIPADAMAALEVRFMDRFFDLHVMDAAQHAVNGAISGDAVKRRDGMRFPSRSSTLPTPGWRRGWRRRAGPAGMISRWPTARRHRRCSTPTGCTAFPRPLRSFAPIARACWRGRRWRAPWTAHALTVTCSRSAHPTATER